MERGQELIATLQALAKSLQAAGLPCCLVGGLAVSILCGPRATEDIDFVVLLDDGGRERVQGVLRSHFKIWQIRPDELRLGDLLIWRVLLAAPGQPESEVIVDFLHLADDETRRILQRARPMRLGREIVPVISPEDLIILKSRSRRLRDQADVETLRATYNGRMDDEYLQHHLRPPPSL